MMRGSYLCGDARRKATIHTLHKAIYRPCRKKEASRSEQKKKNVQCSAYHSPYTAAACFIAYAARTAVTPAELQETVARSDESIVARLVRKTVLVHYNESVFRYSRVITAASFMIACAVIRAEPSVIRICIK